MLAKLHYRNKQFSLAPHLDRSYPYKIASLRRRFFHVEFEINFLPGPRPATSFVVDLLSRISTGNLFPKPGLNRDPCLRMGLYGEFLRHLNRPYFGKAILFLYHYLFSAGPGGGGGGAGA